MQIPTACGVTVSVVVLTAAPAIPLQPDAVNGAVPPWIVTCCAAAVAPANPTLAGTSLIAAAGAFTVTVTGAVWPLASSTKSTHGPAATGATVIVDPETDACTTLVQPVTEYGALPPEMVTCCCGAVAEANVSDAGFTPSGGAVPYADLGHHPAVLVREDVAVHQERSDDDRIGEVHPQRHGSRAVRRLRGHVDVVHHELRRLRDAVDLLDEKMDLMDVERVHLGRGVSESSTLPPFRHCA